MKYTHAALLLFIDAYVDEYEYISFTVLQYYFGIGRSQYSSLISEYLKDQPSQLRYEMKGNTGTSRCYRKSMIFERQYNRHMASFDIIEHHCNIVGKRARSLSALRLLTKSELNTPLQLVTYD